MAFSESLASRIRDVMAGKRNIEEKKMFGGVGFLLGGNMACGVHGEGMIVRIGPERHAAALARPHVRAAAAGAPTRDERRHLRRMKEGIKDGKGFGRGR